MDKDSFRIYLRALELDDHLITYKWRNDIVYQDGIASVNSRKNQDDICI